VPATGITFIGKEETSRLGSGNRDFHEAKVNKIIKMGKKNL
jgi:hypothetical protein